MLFRKETPLAFKRVAFIETLASALSQRDDVLALWECGSAAFGRTDTYSDIDLEAVVAAGSVETEAQAAKKIIGSLAPIEREVRLADAQGVQFYWQLQDLPRFTFVDLTLSKQKAGGHAIDTSIHGRPIVHFNRRKALRLCKEPAEDRAARVQSVCSQAQTFDWLHPILVEKQIARGLLLQAYGEYQRSMIRPLIDLLRAKHCPQRSSWQTTYISHDLPPEVVRRLEGLMLVSTLEEMERNLPEISAWRRELVPEMQATKKAGN